MRSTSRAATTRRRSGISPGERYGAVYQINYLRCILCGLCVEACPTRALTMTNEYELADDSRESLIWTKEQLSPRCCRAWRLRRTRCALGENEEDYYRLRCRCSRPAERADDEQAEESR